MKKTDKQKLKEFPFPKLYKTDETQGYSFKAIMKFCKVIGLDTTFEIWFSGQTGFIYKNIKCVYDYDFRRFLEQNNILYLKEQK